jgi:molybdopterin converting factor small subunit
VNQAVFSVRVLYFAEAARRVGKAEECIGEALPCTLGELQSMLYRRHEQLAELRQQLLWSVDEEVAVPETALHPGCVVGVLPPFSGG